MIMTICIRFIKTYKPRSIKCQSQYWSHDSIVEPTYVLMGSPGHYQLIIIFLKLSFFSSDILHDICLNKLFVIVIVIVIVIGY